MANRTLTITHDGTDYTGEIGTITQTRLGYEDHGIMSAYLSFSGDGWGVTAGGYALDDKPENGGAYRRGTAFGMDHVIQIMRTIGVKSWEGLKDREAIVLFEGIGSTLGRYAVGIAALTDDRVLIFREHANSWTETKENS